jgi:CRP-like cAMP-binding protein
MQVCLLGAGAIIGDMAVRETAGGLPRRSATAVALTELVTFMVPLKEFKRRMPADVLEVRGVRGACSARMRKCAWASISTARTGVGHACDVRAAGCRAFVRVLPNIRACGS